MEYITSRMEQSPTLEGSTELQLPLLTNEEKKVILYNDTTAYTVPAMVTATTPLDTLNLNWRERDLPERERTKHVHRLHPYLGKFIPQLAEIFLRKYFTGGQTVLDPFCGSGTTLIQANELSINSVGYDISAFNILLCKAKTAAYSLAVLEKEVLDILHKTAAYTQGNAPSLQMFEPNVEIRKSDSPYLTAWFAPQALQELLTYRTFIDNGNYNYPDILRVILSRSARSARLTTHFDLDFPKTPQKEPYWCYKHSRMCQPTTDAFKFLRRYSLDTINRVKEFSRIRSQAEVSLFNADSRTARFPSIDGVITSPPYVGLIDYHEQHTYAYELLNLTDNRAAEIGPAANGSSLKAKQQYRKDIGAVFANILPSLPSGAPIIVVAGDRYDLYEGIGKDIGIHTEAVLQRHVNRRTGRRSTQFYESVFVWRKR